MTKTEQDAMRDLYANAAALRQAAGEVPAHDKPRRLRLHVGALQLEDVAAFIYWRAQTPEARDAAREAA
jgi:hypothetical protein